MARKRRRKPVVKETKRLVISLDRNTITAIVTILSALGISGAGTFWTRGSVEEAKTGSGIHVQESWQKTRESLLRLATSTKILAQQVEELQRNVAGIKDAVNQIQKSRGQKPVFISDQEGPIEKIDTAPFFDIVDLPKEIQFPKMERIQAAMQEQEKGKI